LSGCCVPGLRPLPAWASSSLTRHILTFEDALSKLKPSLQKIAHVLIELSPDETEIVFGLKVGGETGMIIAKGTGEVNFRVRMCWKTNN
jgi:hypothetical protein